MTRKELPEYLLSLTPGDRMTVTQMVGLGRRKLMKYRRQPGSASNKRFLDACIMIAFSGEDVQDIIMEGTRRRERKMKRGK